MATMHQLDTIIGRAMRQKYNVMLLSQPALGKTTAITKFAMEQQAKNPDFFFDTMDGGTLAPTDVVMSMPDMTDQQIVRLVDGRLPNGYKTPNLEGILYVGEWMLMSLEVSRGFQKLINHEPLGGGFKLADGVIVVADGNRLKDRSGGQAQGRAQLSRFLSIELEYDPDYALGVSKSCFHNRISTFHIRNPGHIDNYADVFESEARSANDITAQEGKRGIWANLRSWDRVSRMLHDAEHTGEAVLPDEIANSVGSGVAATFEVWQKMLDNLATMEDIINDPKGTTVPERMDERYGMALMLAMTVHKDTFAPISVYMNRFPGELQASFFRTMNDRLGRVKDGNTTAIRSSKEYRTWITAPHISKLLQGAVS